MARSERHKRSRTRGESAPAAQSKSRAKARAKSGPQATRSPPGMAESAPRAWPDPRPTPAGNNLGVVKSIGGRVGDGVVCVHMALHRGETITYGTSSVGTAITATELVDHERIVYVEQRNVRAENLGSAIIFGLSSGRCVAIEGVPGEPIRDRSRVQAHEGTQIYGLRFDHGELVDIRVTSCFLWT